MSGRVEFAAGVGLFAVGLWVAALGGPRWGWLGLCGIGALVCLVDACRWVLECADAARGER